MYRIRKRFDEKLLKYIITLSHCPRNQYSKNQINRIIVSHENLLLKSLKSTCLKLTLELSGNDYGAATLPKSYLTVIGIIMQSLKSI